MRIITIEKEHNN